MNKIDNISGSKGNSPILPKKEKKNSSDTKIQKIGKKQISFLTQVKKFPSKIFKLLRNTLTDASIIFHNILHSPYISLNKVHNLRDAGWSNKFISNAINGDSTFESLNHIIKILINNKNSAKEIIRFVEKLNLKEGWKVSEIKTLLNEGWTLNSIKAALEEEWSPQEILSKEFNHLIDKHQIFPLSNSKIYTKKPLQYLNKMGWKKNKMGIYSSEHYIQNTLKESPSNEKKTITINDKKIWIDKTFHKDFIERSDLIEVDGNPLFANPSIIKNLEQDLSEVSSIVSQKIGADPIMALLLESKLAYSETTTKKYSLQLSKKDPRRIESAKLELTVETYPTMKDGRPDKTKAPTYYTSTTTLYFDNKDYKKGRGEMKIEKVEKKAFEKLREKHQTEILNTPHALIEKMNTPHALIEKMKLGKITQFIEAGWTPTDIQQLLKKGWKKEDLILACKNEWTPKLLLDAPDKNDLYDIKNILSLPASGTYSQGSVNRLKKMGWKRDLNHTGKYISSSYVKKYSELKKDDKEVVINNKKVKIDSIRFVDFDRSGLFIKSNKNEQIITLTKDKHIKGLQQFPGLEEDFGKVSSFLAQTAVSDLIPPLKLSFKLRAFCKSKQLEYTKYLIIPDKSGERIESVIIEHLAPTRRYDEKGKPIQEDPIIYARATLTIHFEDKNYNKGTSEIIVETINQTKATEFATAYKKQIPYLGD